MILYSDSIGPEDGFREINWPSPGDLKAMIKSVLSRDHEKGFDFQLANGNDYIYLYSDFYMPTFFKSPLQLKYLEYDAEPELLNSAPANKYEMLLHKKSYYKDVDSIIWEQIKIVEIDEIIKTFKSFLLGNDYWKSNFLLEFGSRMFPNKTAYCLNYFSVTESDVRAELKNKYKQKALRYHPDKVATLGSKIREVAESEMKLINAAYNHLKAAYSI